MIRIYKLKYTDKEKAIADLLAKGVYQEIDGELSYGDGIDAVVEVGLIIDQEATFDENGNLLTEPTYREGYHFDIMVEKDIDFGDNEIFPNNSKHTFAGI
jgi:transcriptional regulator CtsR